MTIPFPDLPTLRRGGCPAMTVDLRKDAPGQTMEVDIAKQTLRVDLSPDNCMHVSICWPPVHFDIVVHEGEPVMHEGEFIFLLVQD